MNIYLTPSEMLLLAAGSAILLGLVTGYLVYRLHSLINQRHYDTDGNH